MIGWRANRKRHRLCVRGRMLESQLVTGAVRCRIANRRAAIFSVRLNRHAASGELHPNRCCVRSNGRHRDERVRRVPRLGLIKSAKRFGVVSRQMLVTRIPMGRVILCRGVNIRPRGDSGAVAVGFGTDSRRYVSESDSGAPGGEASEDPRVRGFPN